EPIPSARQPRPKRVAEKVELLVWVVAASVIVLAIDGLSFCPDAALARIPRTASQAMPATSLPAPHCDNGRSHRRHNARTGWPMVPPHPDIERVMQKEIRQDGADDPTLWRSSLPRDEAPIRHLYGRVQPSLAVEKHPSA